MLTIIVPSCTDSLITSLLTTLKVSSPEPTYKVIVADNGLSEAMRKKHPYVTYVPVPEPFCFSRAVNLAAAKAVPGSDIFVINDDCVIQSESFVESIERALVKAKAEGFGVISPITMGGVGNRDQAWQVPKDEIWLTRETLCFVAVAIPREVWDEIGGLDEDYIYYGFEDVSACRQIVDAGWKLGVAGAAKVKHGNGAISLSSTYRKKYNPKDLEAISKKARAVFEEKWGTGPRMGAYEKGGPAIDRVIPNAQTARPDAPAVSTAPLTTDDDDRPIAEGTAFSDLDPWELTRERLIELTGPVPEHIFALGKDTDLESDVDVLWAIVKLLRPKISVELSTRPGDSTRVIADALIGVPGKKLYVVDAAPKYRGNVAGIQCEIVAKSAEQFFQAQGSAFRMDLCMVDLDPHTKDQTTDLLAICERVLGPRGCVLFHDIVQNRPEIQVKEAVREFVSTRTDWLWVEFPLRPMKYRWPQGGLGLLVRPPLRSAR